MTRGFVVWFTGLSGAGKSTIATALKVELEARGRHVELLDGDEVRTHLSKGLGFSKEDRDTNIRRIGYVARLVARSGGVAITAAISPYREVRDEVRAQTPGFVEVFARAPLDTLVERDVKGLYKKAIAGEIANFTGVSDPYEEPLHAEVVCDTSRESLDQSLSKVLAALERLGHLDREVRETLPEGVELAALRAEATSLSRLEVGQRELSDLFMLASGALSPVDSFMGERDYQSVIEAGRLAGGQPFTIPIVLRADSAPSADRIGLFIGDQPVGILDVTSAFRTSPDAEANGVYGTTDLSHPGVRVLQDSGRWALAGAVTALARPTSGFPEYDLTPVQVRAVKAARGWKTMVGFQTRNPVHRAHEYLQKVALEIVDGLLLHPLVGETKSDDIPASVRMSCYEELLRGYFPADRVLLATNPAWMRYAGPKEAVFHAIVRRNYGCTHFIVGRDHAGVGSYYDTYAAHRIFDQYAPGELGIEILRFEHTFYCSACGGMASTRTCPHAADLHRTLSGTAVRKLLAEGHDLPVEFTRPEVARVLLQAAKEEVTALGVPANSRRSLGVRGAP
jgi:ATP sulfurylase/adenylyl-sulfate kinase